MTRFWLWPGLWWLRYRNFPPVPEAPAPTRRLSLWKSSDAVRVETIELSVFIICLHSRVVKILPSRRLQDFNTWKTIDRQSSVCDKWIFPGIIMMCNILRFLSANEWREDLKWSSGEMLHGHEWVSERVWNFHVLHFVMLHDPQNNLAINLIWRRSTRNLAAVAVNFSVKLNPGYFRVLILNVRHRKFNPAVWSNGPDSYRLLVKSSLAKLL